jgi:sec-independent protein translocase protein TatA
LKVILYTENLINKDMNVELAFLGGLGGWEILLILLVLLIFFGAKKIPELAKGLGKGIKEFKNATNEIKDEIEEGVKDLDTK